MSLKQLLQEKREEIINIAAKHSAFNVRVFGSVARGEETENSDIDFLIDYDLSKTSPWFPGGLLVDLEDAIRERILKEVIKISPSRESYHRLPNANQLSTQIPHTLCFFIILCLRRNLLHKRLATFLLSVPPAPISTGLAIFRIRHHSSNPLPS